MFWPYMIDNEDYNAAIEQVMHYECLGDRKQALQILACAVGDMPVPVEKEIDKRLLIGQIRREIAHSDR